MNGLRKVAERIEPGMRVGIDGVIGAGKTAFADALAALVPATRLGIDAFHRPAADGIFLHQPELRDVWDLSVRLTVDRGTARERALARDEAWMEDAVARYERRYGPAEDRYLAEVDPASLADLVVDTA